MASSDDDVPLMASKINGKYAASGNLSKDTISRSVDKAMDRAVPSAGNTRPGISIRNGPVQEVDSPMPDANGVETNGGPFKRKVRESLSRPSYADAGSSEDDDKPLSKRRKTAAGRQGGTAAESDSDHAPLVGKTNGKISKKPPRASDAQIGESSDSDVPIGKKLAVKKHEIEKQAEKDAVAIRREEKKAPPASVKQKTKAKAKAKAKAKESPNNLASANAGQKSTVKPAATKKANGIKVESSDDDVPLAKQTGSGKTSKKVKSETSPPVKKAKGTPVKKEETAEDDDEAEEEAARWWDNPMVNDGTKKWDTLEHAGVVFPPPYEPLPKDVKMLYDGKPVSMHPDAEEVASFFGSMLNSTHNVENPTFQKNFFNDFKEILKTTGGAKDSSGQPVAVKEFARCDFQPIFNYYDAQREAKKALPAAEKKALKAAKDAAEAPYMYCIWDGRKQKVGNFRVEPPGLFRGRGEHPKTGKVKTRVQPEQITINIGKEATVPAPPEGQRWKEIKHDQEGTWLAMWQENINNNYKYVMLAANSDVKGQSDYKKFEKARELKKHIDKIRADYRKGLRAELTADRQKATAVYLIDQFALRAGNEKGEDEADTVGCCSLKFEHVTLKPPTTVIFDFLGKDSIRFYDEVEVDPQVFKNLVIFKKAPKKEGDEIFDRLTTSALNKHLANYMPGLTAKVFRTYNASYTMARLLKNMKETNRTALEKVNDYNAANREVAILCNHKRTVNAAHEEQMEKMTDRIKGLRYQQWRVKQMMLEVDAKIKKKKGAEFFELPSDLDEAWILEHQAYLVEEETKKITKKFEKENEKVRAEGGEELKHRELEERLEAAKELEKKFKKENKSKKVEAEGRGPTIEKLEHNLEKLDQRIKNMELQAQDKESNKEVALGTSKINYIDPRLTVVFSKKFNVPIEKFFSKTLREKFEWAIKSADEDWEF